MSKQSVKSAIVDKYSKLTLIELEKTLERLKQQQDSRPDRATNQEISAARIALQQRQHLIKAKVMQFEQTNNRHLLFFVSTQGFVKLAGRSALFFSMTIADRINWRCSLKPDTDHYSPSDDGIISFKNLDRVSIQMSQINIFPDLDLSDSELHYFKLTKTYSDEQVAKLRDNSRQDIKRITEIILPASPMPTLYDSITQASQLIYYLVKHSSDGVFRGTIGRKMVEESCDMSNCYLRFAALRGKSSPEDLAKIVELAGNIRRTIAYGSRIQIIHHRDARRILEELIKIERLATSAYNRILTLPKSSALPNTSSISKPTPTNITRTSDPAPTSSTRISKPTPTQSPKTSK